MEAFAALALQNRRRDGRAMSTTEMPPSLRPARSTTLAAYRSGGNRLNWGFRLEGRHSTRGAAAEDALLASRAATRRGRFKYAL